MRESRLPTTGSHKRHSQGKQRLCEQLKPDSISLTVGQTALDGLKVKPVIVFEAMGCEGAGPKWPASWHGESSAKPPFLEPPMTTKEDELVWKFTLRVSPCATE